MVELSYAGHKILMDNEKEKGGRKERKGQEKETEERQREERLRNHPFLTGKR